RAAASGVAGWTVRAIGRDARRIAESDARLADVSAQVAGAVAELGRWHVGFAVQRAQSRDGANALQQWDAARSRAAVRLDELSARDDAAHEGAAEMRTAFTAYDQAFATYRTTSPAADGDDPAARALSAAWDDLDRLSAALVARARDRMTADSVDLGRRLAYATAGFAAALAIVILIAVGLYGFVYRPLTTEITAIADKAAALAQSQAERDRMQASVMKLLDEISGVAEGDLSVQAEVTADVTGALADSFNFMIGQLRAIIRELQNTSGDVASALTDLRSSTAKLAAGSEDQAAQAVEASVAIEQMAASIHYVSENASSSASVAEQARTNAEHGARAVTRTIEGMKAVRDQVQETAKRIKRLGESSQEIGEIVELIGDIADRTSILALNASIQAAMAGDAGRGFAVVADEVERLADRATEATKRAAMLVKTTQTEAAEVMAAMEDTTREVINRSNIANEAGVALSEIQGVSNRLAELIQAISDAAQQQARGSEQVAKSMNEMSSVTRTTAASTKQTATAINALGLLVETLNAVVTRFRLPEAADAPAAAHPRLVASR
ncbi:MAG TPA: methyl-accepting chemotaxis protein, partial [Vicinamibacterales bacterium]|nr:methyl-accepting chemotaxis protein [Vicinamibacterales bacterium]